MRKTIFIIDDDPLVRLIVEKMLSKIDASLTFIHCEDGKVGLEKLIGHQGDRSEYIVLLDLNMPVLNGWEFLDEIQSVQVGTHQKLSLYIFSSSTDKMDVERAGKYSIVKKFYHKPLSNVDIAEILNLNN